VLAVSAPDAANRGTTWRWDGRGWRQLTPPTAAGVEPLSARLAYDPATRATLLVEAEFEGADGHPAGGTWSWDGVTWTEHHAAPPVVGAVDVTDPVATTEGRLVLVGGPLGPDAYREAWAWDGSAWRPR
jgi:hypothetical protein